MILAARRQVPCEADCDHEWPKEPHFHYVCLEWHNTSALYKLAVMRSPRELPLTGRLTGQEEHCPADYMYLESEWWGILRDLHVQMMGYP